MKISSREQWKLKDVKENTMSDFVCQFISGAFLFHHQTTFFTKQGHSERDDSLKNGMDMQSVQKEKAWLP